jgi:hypothetical protein
MEVAAAATAAAAAAGGGGGSAAERAKHHWRSAEAFVSAIAAFDAGLVHDDDIRCGTRHLYIKTIILPRQARDKHRENSSFAPFLYSK